MIRTPPVPLLLLEEADAGLALVAVEALERELARVAPAQLKRVRALKADLGRYLAECRSARCAGATDGGDRSSAAASSLSGMRTVARDRLTAAQAASLLGLSASFVRRNAEAWGGELVAGRWLLPRDVIEQEQRRRTPR